MHIWHIIPLFVSIWELYLAYQKDRQYNVREIDRLRIEPKMRGIPEGERQQEVIEYEK